MRCFKSVGIVLSMFVFALPLFAQPGSVLINEIMYDDTATNDIEWVELFNTQPFPISVSNWVLTDGSVWPPPSSEGAIQIPPGVLINSFGYLVISKTVMPGIPSVVCNEIDATWTLNNGGDNLALFDGPSPTSLLIDGSLTAIHPDAAGTNAGNSVEKCNEFQPWTSDPLAWHESTFPFAEVGRYRHCTPGFINSHCLPSCAGSLTVPALMIMPNTYVGTSNMMSIPVTNSSAQPVCIDSVRTNGYIFSTNDLPPQILPGENVNLDVIFSPTFPYDFEGHVVLYHSQSGTPSTQIEVLATACRPASPPPPPFLLNAASPTDIYFSLPWDLQNTESTELAVEYSSNGFATSSYVDFPFGSEPVPMFATAGMWGQGSEGIISGLTPNTVYEVRLIARDCLGNTVIGVPSAITTEPDLQLITEPDLTIQVIHADSVRLRWNPLVGEVHGRPIQGLTWGIFFGTDINSIDDLLGTSDNGTYDFGDVDSLSQGYFVVRAMGDGVADQPSPFISWPPLGADIQGLNSIVLKDFAHFSEWDSFTVELDPLSSPVLLGSSHRNPWSFSGKRSVAYDFTATPPGPHIIRATIVAHDGAIYQSEIPVNVHSVYPRDFTAELDQTLHTYTLDTTGIGWEYPNIPNDILWLTSKGQRYGSPITLEYDPTSSADSLILTKIVVPSITNILSETGEWFDDARQVFGGVQPVPAPAPAPKVEYVNIACCCDNLEVRTAGTADGTYCGQKNVPLGSIVKCKDGNYEVGFAFEVVLTFKYFKAENSSDCTWGQDAKGDRLTELGKCKNGAFEPLKPPRSLTSHKEYGGVEFPYAGAAYGNDDYRPDNHGGTLDQSQQIKGKVRWWDAPSSSGRIPAGFAIRSKGDNKFFARADPQCQPVNIECCRSWEIVWDVTFCDDCTTITTTAPTFQNEQTPATCPGLAAN